MNTAPDRPAPRGRSGAHTRPGVGTRTAVLLLAVIALLTLTGAAAVDNLRAARAADLAAERGSGPRIALPVARRHHAPPVALRITRLHLDTRLTQLRRRTDGSLQTPRRADVAGWYVGSARPGDAGPTVLAGHVDSTRGPGIFHDLRLLHRGDRIVVTRSDRTTALFVVTRVVSVPKRRFPTSQVYGGEHPGLRLITCGGQFDERARHYRNNVIVFAELRVPPPGRPRRSLP